MATRSKTCSQCFVEKPTSEFYARSGRGEGLAAFSACCKQCTRDFRRQDPIERERRKATDARRYRNQREALDEQNRAWRATKRRKLIDFLGGVCSRCGFDDIRALQVDHVNGGGARHRKADPTVVSVGGLLKAVRAEPSEFTVLCANCNWIKRAENKEYAR